MKRKNKMEQHSLPLRSPTKSVANSIKGQKKLTNKANTIRVRKLCVLLFIKTSRMSIRAFLYSRRAEEGSEQTQWPSAILPIDNDPDKDTLAISQTSNKAKHSLSSANNLCAAARVMDKPAASSECEEGNKALDGQEVAESIPFIDLGLFTAWWRVAVTTFFFFFFIPQTHKDKEYCRKEKKNIHSAKHFTFQQSILLVRSFARPLMATHTTLHTHTHTCRGGIFPEIGEVNSLLFS